MSATQARLLEVLGRMGPSAFEHAAEALQDQADQQSDEVIVQATKIRAVDFLEVASLLHAQRREAEATRVARPLFHLSEVGDLPPDVDVSDQEPN